MKVGAVILCRYDSTRLFGKALKVINEKPILEWITLYIKLSPLVSSFCVATSIEKSDDPIAEFCEVHNIPLFRGSKNDVAGRFLQCARLNKFDYAFRVNGDNLFVEPTMLTTMVQYLEQKPYDFISNVPGRTFPFGMSVELLNVNFFEQINRSLRKGEYREHVTLYLYDNPELGERKYIVNEKWKHLAGLQLAIDTIEDMKRAENIFTRVGGDYRMINYALLDNMAEEGQLL